MLGIDGMACGMCEAHVADTVRSHFKVKKVKADRKKKNAVIITEEEIPETQLKAAIDATGYTVTSYDCHEYVKKGLFGF